MVKTSQTNRQMNRWMSRIWLLSLLPILLTSCQGDVVYERYMEIEAARWEYVKPITFDVEVKELGQKMDLYVNLRHTNDYPYANLWLKLFYYPPEGDPSPPTQQRLELKLAKANGKWIGSGLGTTISHEIKIKSDLVFNRTGVHSFTIQHDMREQVVPAIDHVGLRLEKSED